MQRTTYLHLGGRLRKTGAAPPLPYRSTPFLTFFLIKVLFIIDEADNGNSYIITGAHPEFFIGGGGLTLGLYVIYV
jgi:hypothetical protein